MYFGKRVVVSGDLRLRHKDVSDLAIGFCHRKSLP